MTRNTNSVNGGAMPRIYRNAVERDRRHFIGGSDARIIMGKDEEALLRLWREKRGEEAPPDLSSVLTVQLGLATGDLNRRWYELNSGHRISDIQRHAVHRTIPWMAATLDGLVKETGAVFEAMLPSLFSEEAAAEKAERSAAIKRVLSELTKLSLYEKRAAGRRDRSVRKLMKIKQALKIRKRN